MQTDSEGPGQKRVLGAFRLHDFKARGLVDKPSELRTKGSGSRVRSRVEGRVWQGVRVSGGA